MSIESWVFLFSAKIQESSNKIQDSLLHFDRETWAMVKMQLLNEAGLKRFYEWQAYSEAIIFSFFNFKILPR